MHEFRHALRQLLRRRPATALSVGLLALGVGLATSFYSVLDRALLSGLPLPNGDRLVAFSTRDAAGWPMPLDDYRAIAAAQRSFEWTEPLRTFNTMLTRGNGTQGMIGSYVTAELFRRLGVEPILGRGFTASDADPANPPVALISHRLWHGAYGADAGILGEQIVLNREPTLIVGVMPPGFRFPLRHDVWGIQRERGREWSESQVFGLALLTRGRDLEDARRDLGRIAALLDESEPQPQPRRAELDSYVRTNIGDRARGGLQAMVLAALVLLLLTCANLANLRMSETLRRRRELGTRLALGSGPAGLVRLLLYENLLVGLLGAGAAVGSAWLLTTTLGRTLLAGSSLGRAYWIEARLDADVVGLAAGTALAAAFLGALLPIGSTLVASRRQRLGAAASSKRHHATTRALVSVQIGLCFALLTTAGLFSLRARELLGSDLGFRAEHLSSLMLSTYQTDLRAVEERRALYERLERELALQPEIAAIGLASSSPWGHVPSRPVAAGGDPDLELSPRAGVLEVSPGFFRALELPLVAGRTFAAGDARAGDRIAILSRSLANRLFAGEAVGRSLTIGGPRRSEPATSVRVVGVVADLGIDRTDSRDRNLDIYLPHRAAGVGAYLITRSATGADSIRGVVESTLARIEPRVGTLDELSVEQALSASTWVERRLGQILSLFGIAALLLTAAGTYAVIAVMVRGRERELGIRAAVGARPLDLGRLVLHESTVQLLLGLSGGAALLLAVRGLLDSTSSAALAWQPTVIVAAALLVGLSSLAGSWGPSARAARADPTRCLRAE